MGILKCPNCKAKTTADSIEEGRERLDHAIGLYLGRPCYDGLAELQFIGTEKKTSTKPSSTNDPKKNVIQSLKAKITQKSDSKTE